MLPAADIEFLKSKGLDFTVTMEGGAICVLVRNFALPSGLSVAKADLLLRLMPGYPDLPPDMWWFSPAVFCRDGSRILATESIETHLGRQWQRWSRHLDAQRWMAGIDSLESYFTLIASELGRAIKAVA